jgi:hypothetical protein
MVAKSNLRTSRPPARKRKGVCMKFRTCMWNIAMCLFAALAITLQLSAQDKPDHQATFTTFDVPGAGTGSFQGTFPLDINPEGAITGYYFDASNAFHGFLHAKDGTAATFDVPGAGGGRGTAPYSINPAGAITGTSTDASNVDHGFLRAPDGTITTFDFPGAGTGAFQGTIALNINPAGAIAGFYIDASSVFHGLLRAEDGAFTTFDAPGAGTGFLNGTLTASEEALTPAGAIAGYYRDGSNAYHGYLRSPDGSFTTFDCPGAGTGAFQGTLPGGINPAGTIPGTCLDASNVNHGFVRGTANRFPSSAPARELTASSHRRFRSGQA